MGLSSEEAQNQIKLFWLGRLKKTACLIVEDDNYFKPLKQKIDGIVWPQGKAQNLIYIAYIVIGSQLQVINVGNVDKIVDVLKSEPQSIDLQLTLNEQQIQFLDQLLNYQKPIKKIVIPPKEDPELVENVKPIPVNPLDLLFKKTQAKPALYFLPNTSDEVLAKKRVDLQKIKQQSISSIQLKRSRSRSIEKQRK
ncbi:UNKNOWN [Stylonychia lemnae]|uniref:Uncharacterized protein n=1 Tax=Stylonychia lemnae TaxID=5949 RepID=A0A077ZWG6_STYLE|nr:UNKNOWN [Stylonychia lemnae]|eukprot:CDW73610.1 UNKNOWN [Stylonychia lemnae]